MKGTIQLAKAVAIATCFAALGGCATTSGDFPLRYATTADSSLPESFEAGQTYAFDRFDFSNIHSGSEEEWAEGIEEIRYHLQGSGLTEIDDVSAADYIFQVTVGYLPDTYNQRIPIYSGGDRQRVDVERDEPQYDSQGRYIGTRRVHETQYITTPRVQTDVKNVAVESEQPVIVLTIFEQANYRADGEYGATDAHEFPFSFQATAVSEIDPTTIAQTAHCLARDMLSTFPKGHVRTVQNVRSHYLCAAFTDHTESTDSVATGS